MAKNPTRRIVTAGGYTHPGHARSPHQGRRPQTGEWAWKRLADIAAGDLVPMQLGTMIGEPRLVPLPVLDQAYYAGDRNLYVPDAVDEELAELVGYFMGDGSLHAKGIRLCVADTDLDVVDRMRMLSKRPLRSRACCYPARGLPRRSLCSRCGSRAGGRQPALPRRSRLTDHVGKGWTPRVPSALLETNDVNVYAAFIRGLFEADGTVLVRCSVCVDTRIGKFRCGDPHAAARAWDLPTTTRETVSGFGGPIFQVRVRNLDHAAALLARRSVS